ncbi:MORN repeat-containing protein 4 homolog isoform X3 [Periplaneta americana]|uniref:MORN repeat-containing protein 4 homolog isoform X3 n=1 Tax=Periplaneta americana TaxID=6978 RepID=UPI0037E77684
MSSALASEADLLGGGVSPRIDRGDLGGICRSRNVLPGVVKTGAYRYEDGTRYVGDWNQRGQKHGMGHLSLPDGTRYDGAFQNGLCGGLGVMCFPDGAKYEGEFMQGWFHGHGVFWRSDGMKFEGEFRGGRIWGLVRARGTRFDPSEK